MIFWVNACRSFTLENIRWKNMSFRSGSVRIDSVLTSPGIDHCHTQAPTTWHWTWRKPPSEPPFRLWSQTLKPDSYLCRVILFTAEKKKGAPPYLVIAVFLSPRWLRQKGVGGFFLSLRDQKPGPWCSVYPQHTGTWPAQWHGTSTQCRSDGHDALGYHFFLHRPLHCQPAKHWVVTCAEERAPKLCFSSPKSECLVWEYRVSMIGWGQMSALPRLARLWTQQQEGTELGGSLQSTSLKGFLASPSLGPQHMCHCETLGITAWLLKPV